MIGIGIVMKIIVLSDTHLSGDLPEEILRIAGEADIVVHAGDFDTVRAYESLRSSCKRLIAVYGNSDEADLMINLSETETFEVEGIRIGVIHRGQYSTDTTNMRYLALEMGVDILIYGHIHRPIIEKSDVLLICPGSPTFPRMSDPAVVELDVSKGNVTGKVIKVSCGTTCDYINYARSLRD